MEAGAKKNLGRSGDLSPYNDMKSLYFDDSLYENEMHYRISQLLDETPLDDECEEIRIICDNEREYNDVLNALYHHTDGNIKMYGVSYNPMEVIIEKDPRLKYRKFDEEAFLMKDKEET